MFNALKYTEELEKAGFTREQAEASLRLLVETMNENFAIKSDLKELEWKLESKINTMESRLDLRIQSLESSIKEMEYKLTIKLGSMMAIAIGVTATLVRIIPGVGH